MADLILSDGREITLDLTQITLREYRALFSPHQPEEEDASLAKVAGLTLEEYQTLPYPDWRRITTKFFERAREPLTDPNSQGASSST
jgi:hypothetical protein